VSAGWERQAASWIAWARDERDAYWEFRETFFELVPPAGRRTLEIGSGEGRVSRDLAKRGHGVVGLEPSRTLREAAVEADPGGEYVDGAAESLPFANASFDLVVAYNSLMDVDDMPAALREAARVLEAEGRLCACVTHPLTDVGRFEGRSEDARFVIRGSLLDPGIFDETFERGDLRMRFRGHTYPLGAYFEAVEHAGLLVEAVREPRSGGRWARIPSFLMFRAVRRDA
jgi:SAM-dependent methyltransferase